MTKRGNEFRGQQTVLDGSRSGSNVPILHIAYDISDKPEYIGEAAIGALDNYPKWYIEKIIYNISDLIEAILIASNKIYAGAVSVAIDIVVQAPLTQVTITGASPELLGMLKIGDSINLTTPANANKIQGAIRTNNGVGKLGIEVEGATGVVNEATVAIGATNLIFTLNNPETHDLNQRSWNLRELYIYE